MNRSTATLACLAVVVLVTHCRNAEDDEDTPGAAGSMGEAGTSATAAGAPSAGDGAGGSSGGKDASDGCAGATPGSGGASEAGLAAVAWLQPDSCERFVAYEVRDVRNQDGLPVTDYTCEWTFSDGGVENTCAGTKTFGELPGTFHGSVVVRDAVTRASTTAVSEAVQVIEPQGLEIFVSSQECLQFSYDIDRQYGCGGTHVFAIQPAESILTPGPWSNQSQTLQVSSPGVYTLEYTIEGCAASYARTCVTSTTAQVTVADCPEAPTGG